MFGHQSKDGDFGSGICIRSNVAFPKKEKYFSIRCLHSIRINAILYKALGRAGARSLVSEAYFFLKNLEN